MIKNYLKIAYRNILKNKGTTFINTFGMALAIGCCMLVYEFVDFSFNMDDFHSKREEIYVLQRQMDINGDLSFWGDVPQDLGPALKADFEGVKEVVRVNQKRGILKYGEKVFNHGISFVDDAYYELLDFPIKWGNPATFADPDGMVITENISEKYFGEKNPIGEIISIRFIQNEQEILEQFVIKGVLEKRPPNASFYPNITIPFERLKIFGETEIDWTKLSNPTFIHVDNKEAIAAIKNRQQKYLDIINSANQDWKMVGIHCQPFNGIGLQTLELRNSPFGGILKLALVIVGLIGIFLLLMACFNYLNIALASANTRLKEISVRKVIGGTRRQIIIQFLIENLLICTAALLLGIALAHTLFLPWFNDLLGNGDILKLSYLSNPKTWLFTLALLIIVTIGGAGYPALYISKFQPVAIIKKEFGVGSKSSFQKWLVGAQLFFSILTIFSAISGYLLNNKIKQKNWGYNQHNIALIHLDNGKDFKAFKTDIESHPSIIEVSGSHTPIGRVGLQEWKAQYLGQDYVVQGATVAANYLQTLEIPLIDGRYFNANQQTDQHQSIIVNETFRQLMNWDKAVGQRIKIANQTYSIVGEVKDVYQKDFIRKIRPFVFKLGSEDHLPFVSIRTKPGMAVSTVKALSENWKKFYSNAPYVYSYQDNSFHNYYSLFNQGEDILKGAGLISFIICTIGIFGLAMLILNRKMKEISIRKVLGAGRMQIARLIQKDFLFPLLVAMIFALPMSHVLMKTLAYEFAPFTTFDVVPFLLTIISIFLMVVFSLSKHIYTAIHSDPQQYLRDE